MELRYRLVLVREIAGDPMRFVGGEFECTRDELKRRIQAAIQDAWLAPLLYCAEYWNNETQEWELVH